jgi:hypothetical protein
MLQGNLLKNLTQLLWQMREMRGDNDESPIGVQKCVARL